MLTTWSIPSSLEEAWERKRIIVAEIEEIEAQLGDRLRKGDMATDESYAEWRKAAVWAWTNRLQELRLLKQWIRQHTEASVLCTSCGCKLAS